jgi:crossover junction endodeoxyribonuclease RusA
VTTFTVHGVPAPQGSTRAFVVGNRAVTTNRGNRSQAAWRDSVAAAAADQASLTGCVTGPVEVTLYFRFPMPKSRKAADRQRGWCWKSTAPDIDKLVRSTLDGLQAGGLLRDDALVVDIAATKREVHDAWTGAVIQLMEATA